ISSLIHADLGDFLNAHLAAAESLSSGTGSVDRPAIWQKDAGKEANRVISELKREAHLGGALSATDYHSVFNSVLSQGEVRNAETVHPNILIWGTLEARVQGAELLILAGLNEGTWPERPDPDPWMNRAMRQKAGLLLPERRIGLAAHDFQQAIAANEVWLTRSRKSDDAETVPSRWINRLTNLLGGLVSQGGADALKGMRARGQEWLNLASELEKPSDIPKYSRPSPKPPIEARPRQLSVTAIKTLIRDPYAIYAKNILGLKPLDPLVQEADAPLRGTLIHEILECFVKGRTEETPEESKARLMAITDTILAQSTPWPTARALWRAKVERVADWFIAREAERQSTMTPVGFETPASVKIPEIGFTLTANADRIDRDVDGGLHIFDYKTGTPPTKKVQAAFDKQLLLEAAMAELGGFHKVGTGDVQSAKFIGLGAKPSEVEAPINDISAAETWDGLKELLERYFDPNKGYSSRRAMQKEADIGRYDHLARFGEWDISDMPANEDPLT
ncbi:MAG: double-strand break repair protein AddB, partial [Paracoccaceae bacterium]|nr:double-strand break repair protein AddB [Paracoccaceae bacterium]